MLNQTTIFAICLVAATSFGFSQSSEEPLGPIMESEAAAPQRNTQGMPRPNVGVPAIPLSRFAQICFFATYGDNTQTYDHNPPAGKVDSRLNYPNMLSGPFNDSDKVGTNMTWDYNITGYPKFNPTRVLEAKLRIDVFINTNDPFWGNDTFACVNDTFSKGQPGYAFALHGNTGTQPENLDATLGKLLKARRAFNPHWISLVFDLTPNPTGGACYAYAISPFGQPIPGKYYGIWRTISNATQTQVLNAAADGDLHGYLQDDTSLGYAELMIRAAN